MEITSTALVSLACMLSNGGADSQASQEALNKLSPEQVAVLEQVVNSGACLPEKFENAIQSKDIPNFAAGTPPSTDL